MSIRLELSDHHDITTATFRPGDIIRGTVIYDLPRQRTIRCATIEFKGTVETEYIPVQQNNIALVANPRRPSHEKTILVTERVTLFEGPYSVPTQVFRWPFQFEIPGKCAPPEWVKVKLPLDDGGELREVDLPPSYAWNGQEITHQAKAVISYKLKVKVERDGLLNNDEKKQVITIRQQAQRLTDLPLKPTGYDFPPVSWSSGKLRPAERRLSLKDRMKSSFSSDPALKSPTLSFQARVYMPNALHASQRFPISVSVSHQKTTNLDPDDPTIILQELKLTLRTHTWIAISTSGFLQRPVAPRGDEILAEHQVHLAHQDPLPLGGALTEVANGLCIGDWWNGDNPGGPPGDFLTWVVQLRHKMAVEVVLKHVESDKNFRMLALFPLKLLNPPRDSTEAGTSAGMAGFDYKDEEELPGYGDDSRPPEHTERL